MIAMVDLTSGIRGAIVRVKHIRLEEIQNEKTAGFTLFNMQFEGLEIKSDWVVKVNKAVDPRLAPEIIVDLRNNYDEQYRVNNAK